MLEKRFRKYYQHYLVDQVAKWLSHYCSANQITLLAGLFGILIIPALYWDQTIIALILLLLSGYCDTLDGSIARLKGSSNPFSCSLDIVMDRVVESAVILGLFLLHPGAALELLLMLIAILLCITSFLVVGIFSDQTGEKSFFYSEGLIERAEAFIFFALMILWPQYFKVLAWVFVILVLLTAALHLWRFKQHS